MFACLPELFVCSASTVWAEEERDKDAGRKGGRIAGTEREVGEGCGRPGKKEEDQQKLLAGRFEGEFSDSRRNWLMAEMVVKDG